MKKCPKCNCSKLRKYSVSFGNNPLKKYVQCLECAWSFELKRSKPPEHYDQEIQPWDVIDAWRLDFWEGNAVKYICRAGKKENNSAVDDYNKAITYLQECIRRAQDG
tara:strand:- start:170 stop:490 length:321 start_codon:yes stop_codon:yes gene_type:complete